MAAFEQVKSCKRASSGAKHECISAVKSTEKSVSSPYKSKLKSKENHSNSQGSSVSVTEGLAMETENEYLNSKGHLKVKASNINPSKICSNLNGVRDGDSKRLNHNSTNPQEDITADSLVNHICVKAMDSDELASGSSADMKNGNKNTDIKTQSSREDVSPSKDITKDSSEMDKVIKQFAIDNCSDINVNGYKDLSNIISISDPNGGPVSPALDKVSTMRKAKLASQDSIDSFRSSSACSSCCPTDTEGQTGPMESDGPSSTCPEPICLESITINDADPSRNDPPPRISPRPSLHRHHHRHSQMQQKQRYKLIQEDEIQVCRLNHTRTIISKIMNSKYLRRWETHTLILGERDIQAAVSQGFMDTAVPYSSIEDVNVISRWDAGQHFCVRLTLADGSILLQAKNAYLRDQWLHSVQWKRHMLKYRMLLTNTRRPEVLVKEIKNMITMSLITPIQDTSLHEFPLDLVSQLILKNDDTLNLVSHEQIIVALAPLLEDNHPTQEICCFFSKHCKDSPRSELIIQLFTPVVHRILKHNTDFGKYPRMRSFIQEYMQALGAQNDGINVVNNFVKSVHGVGSACPHLRVLPNLVAVCLAAIYTCFEDRKRIYLTLANRAEQSIELAETDHRLEIYLAAFQTMSDYSDWRPVLSSLLQPIPFPDDALSHRIFTSQMKDTMSNFATDARCSVHQSVLGIREGKEGWLDLYCPGGLACDDEGELYAILLKGLISCCCRRKKFLNCYRKMIGPWQLLALRENTTAMDVLCAVLEFEICESSDLKMQIITTLQSTRQGKAMYAELCERQIQLRELQQKGGPRKMTLPSRSTDSDLSKLLSSGSFGNLECLSLAFTHVTSACARDLIKLPSLRYLNLWSTQFGDQGLQLLSEHLPKLQVLNLCETPVTDKGLSCLASMKNLRKLNLNSTYLSALTFEGLKEKLPALQEFDVRYTDAW